MAVKPELRVMDEASELTDDVLYRCVDWPGETYVRHYSFTVSAETVERMKAYRLPVPEAFIKWAERAVR